MKITQITLKAWRVDRGLTRGEVAERLGKTKETVQNWERGIRIPDKANLYELANIYKVSIDQIFLADKSNLSGHYNKFRTTEERRTREEINSQSYKG